MNETDAKALTRRSLMRGIAGVALGTVATPIVPARADFALELEPALRSHFDTSGIKFGCAGATPIAQRDPILLDKMSIEANIFIPEGDLKWEYTEPRPNEFNFEGPDSVVDYADRHGMIMYGHTLVWYAALPQWATRFANEHDAQAALERHIGTVVSRYRGKVWAWDVVNEPIEPKEGLDSGYRNSIWLRRLGPGYIDRAFRLTRAADPVTPLCLNEYGIEYTTADSIRRRHDILALLRKLRDLNTPIDCFGLQSHLDGEKTFDRKELTSFLKNVVDLGYKLMITELDVNDALLRGNDADRDIAVARHVAEYLDIVFSVARPRSISTWGLTDRYTWLHQYYKRPDGQSLRPLPLDENLNRKRLWVTLAKYLSS